MGEEATLRMAEDTPGIACDLHVHSRYSESSTNWLKQRFGVPECYTEPAFIYETALARGMTHVTITDHDTIDGCLELLDAGYANVFISCEVTTAFPHDQCKAHVLVYHVDAAQHREIDYLRGNIYELVAYLNHQRIPHAIAHPMYAVNNKLRQAHFAQFLALFDLFELNGFRSREINAKVRQVLGSVTAAQLAEIAAEHHLTSPKLDPLRKAIVCGSDDHSGRFVATSHTKNPGRAAHDLFNRARANAAALHAAQPRDLGYAIYSVTAQHFDAKYDIGKTAAKEPVLSSIYQTLTHKEPGKGGFGRLAAQLLSGRSFQRADAVSQLRKTLHELAPLADDAPVDAISAQWLQTVSQATQASIRDLLGYTLEQFAHANVFNVGRGLGSISSLLTMLLPYYISYKVFQDGRIFAENVPFAPSEPRAPRVAHFTDTLHDTNGVAITLRKVAALARRRGKDNTFITCHTGDAIPGEKAFAPLAVYALPEYPALSLALPPALDVLEHCYQENYTHVHAATPGPVGLMGLITAKLLQRPFITFYHTEFPQYVGRLTGEAGLEELTWQYMAWFYRQADVVLVSSHASRRALEERGVSREKIRLIPRGVDTARFCPGPRSVETSAITLLYVGRISKEKGLDVLAAAYKRIAAPHLRLVIVGDGPYRAELEERLAGCAADFRGHLDGDDLVQAYRDCDLLVFPSATDTFGNVVLEAHACGKPAIVTDAGGPQEIIVDGKTGLVVAANDPAALADGVSTLLDRAKLAAMGADARTWVQHRSFEQVFFSSLWDVYTGTDTGAAAPPDSVAPTVQTPA